MLPRKRSSCCWRQLPWLLTIRYRSTSTCLLALSPYLNIWGSVLVTYLQLCRSISHPWIYKSRPHSHAIPFFGASRSVALSNAGKTRVAHTAIIFALDALEAFALAGGELGVVRLLDVGPVQTKIHSVVPDEMDLFHEVGRSVLAWSRGHRAGTCDRSLTLSDRKR